MELLTQQRKWLEKKLAEIPIHQPSQIGLPESILFLGQPYALQIETGDQLGQVVLDSEGSVCRLILMPGLTERQDLILQALDRFFLAQAREFFHERMIYWSMRMGLQPSKIRLKHLSSRWGSCSSKDAINLNYRAIQLPAECIDAIIVHELAHLRHLNHGKDFWALVHSQLPDYPQRNQLLQQWTNKLL